LQKMRCFEMRICRLACQASDEEYRMRAYVSAWIFSSRSQWLFP